jgi:hypothetical protein
LASLTYKLFVLVLDRGTRHNGATEWALEDALRTVVLDRAQRAHAEVPIDLLHLNVEILIEVKLVRVRTLLLEGSVVLFVLGDYIGLVGEEARRLEVQDEACEMRCRDEVLYFVIVLQGVLVDEELVSPIHSAQRHVAAQLGHAHRVL